ncbi:zinc finger protein OZF-like [Culicoides brevitarsis]|uniref:zinc finger protein OZF-like n=1 Tax=Culicoides brevitarsis TaxID=469753 RepID=UPI00307BDBDF
MKEKMIQIDEESDHDFDFDQEIHENSPDEDEKLPETQKPEVSYTKEQLETMDFHQLNKLPANFGIIFCCPLCSERFKYDKALKTHILQKHFKRFSPEKRKSEAKSYLENIFPQCDLCEKSLSWYLKAQNILDHKFHHYGIKPYKCELCGFATTYKKKIRNHMTKVHIPKSQRSGCFYCAADFASGALRNNHVRKFHAEKLLTCEKCGVKLLDQSTMAKHMQFEHPANFQGLVCEKCPGGVRFPNEHVLELHRKLHEIPTTCRFKCHLCERRYQKEVSLKHHLRLHAENRLIACEICGKTIALEPKGPPQHMRIHKTPKPESFECNECSEKFTTKNFLIAHLKKMHFRRDEPCHKCGKMIPNYYITRHLVTCNSGELKCVYCPMIFKKMSERSKHTKQFHIGFKCKRCNIQFETNSQLEFHQRYSENHKNMRLPKYVLEKKTRKNKNLN